MSDTIAKLLEEPKAEKRELFTFRYKQKNVTRDITIRSTNETVKNDVNRYLKFIAYDTMSKPILIGTIERFGIEVDKEIEKFNKRRKNEGLPLYEEYGPSPERPKVGVV